MTKKNTKNHLTLISVIMLMMMIIAPKSRAHKGEKGRREVKGEYGG